ALRVGARQPLLLRRTTLTGSKLALTLEGRNLPGGTTSLTGSGRHADYGRFTVQAELASDGPHAVLVLDHPLPAAGLRNVRIALAPIAQ
ncbi:hypothetical protein ABTU70_19650, partial [Acinetobacter baumannii]